MGNSCCQLLRRCFSQEVPMDCADEMTNIKFLDNRDGYFSKEELEMLSIKYIEWSKMVQEKLYGKNQSKPIADSLKKPKKIKWKEGEVIGHGSFGRVVSALNLGTGEIMAVKQVHIENLQSSAEKETIKALELEVELLSNLKHKNIVRYIGTAKKKMTLNIFLEYISGGTIASLINKYGKLNETLIRIYATQILEGLEYLHFTGTIHRDIKGANLLVDNHGVCKLADFGSAKRLHSLRGGDNINSLKGTANWMAPEAIMQKDLSRFSDIWSLGCTIIEMATGRPPWSDCLNQISTMYQIAQTKKPPAIPADLSPECIDFLRLCLRRNPRERPNVTKLLQHRFITHLDFHTRNPGKSTPYLGHVLNEPAKPQNFIAANEKTKISKLFDLAPKDPQNNLASFNRKSMNLISESNKNQDTSKDLAKFSKLQLLSQKSQQEPSIMNKNAIPNQTKLNNSVDFSSAGNNKELSITPVTKQVTLVKSQAINSQEKHENLIPKRLLLTNQADSGDVMSISNFKSQGANIKANNFMRTSKDSVSSARKSKELSQAINDPIHMDSADKESENFKFSGLNHVSKPSLRINNFNAPPDFTHDELAIPSEINNNSVLKLISEELRNKPETWTDLPGNLLTLNMADQSFQNSFDVLQRHHQGYIVNYSLTMRSEAI